MVDGGYHVDEDGKRTFSSQEFMNETLAREERDIRRYEALLTRMKEAGINEEVVKLFLLNPGQQYKPTELAELSNQLPILFDNPLSSEEIEENLEKLVELHMVGAVQSGEGYHLARTSEVLFYIQGRYTRMMTVLITSNAVAESD